MDFAKITALFVATAVAEIVGCYLPWLVVKQNKSIWLLFPAAVSLALFAWLLTLHPSAAGRTYAAYGGVYIAVALAWLWVVDGVPLTRWDVAGACVALVGMAIIAMQPIAIVLACGAHGIKALRRASPDTRWMNGLSYCPRRASTGSAVPLASRL